MKPSLFKIFRKFGQYGHEYKELKNNSEKGNISGVFGRRAITNSLIMLLIAAFGIGAGALAKAAFDSDSMLFTVLGVVALAFAAACVVLALMYFVLALSCSIRQLRLNKRTVGVASLITTLVLFAAAVIVAVVVAMQIGL